jgi:hypothetical protein
MATKPIGGETAPVINPLQFTLTPGMAPAAPLMRMLGRYDREKVEAFVEISISLLDLIDGDADIELNGDETDHTNSEECFIDHCHNSTESWPGCPVSDPGGCDHDGREPDDGV